MKKVGSVSIIQAGRKDVASIAVMQRAFCREDICHGLKADTVKTLRKIVGPLSLIARDQKDNAVGYAFGKIKQCRPGKLACFPKGTKYLSVEEIYVIPRFRGRGVGSRLMRQLVRNAGRQGVRRVMIYSAIKDMTRVMRFYRRHGLKTWYVRMFK